MMQHSRVLRRSMPLESSFHFHMEKTEPRTHGVGANEFASGEPNPNAPGGYQYPQGQEPPPSTTTEWAYEVSPITAALSVAGTALGAYHGYRRNHGSLGYGLWWGFAGGLAPVITSAIALAQGFARPI